MSGETVLRTITTTSPTANYLATEQISDFGAVQSQVNVNIYQLSAIVGEE
ncbi:MAG: hypothetical protein AAF195_03375 [Pseudomonadota bacterium]